MNDFDDSIVVLCDGAISVDGVMVSASRSFRRDPRLAQPTAAMLQREYWRAIMTPRVLRLPDGYKYCSSGLRHDEPFADAVVPLTEFANDPRTADGKSYICRHCKKALDARRYQARVGRDVRDYHDRRMA